MVATEIGGLAVSADVSSSEGAARAVEACVGEFGRLDALVFSAGASAGGRVGEQTLERWNLVLGTNLTAAFLAVNPPVPTGGPHDYMIDQLNLLAVSADLKHHFPLTVPEQGDRTLGYHWFAYGHLAASSLSHRVTRAIRPPDSNPQMARALRMPPRDRP